MQPDYVAQVFQLPILKLQINIKAIKKLFVLLKCSEMLAQLTLENYHR